MDLAVQDPGALEPIVRAVDRVADQAIEPGAEGPPGRKPRVGRVAEREVEAHQGGPGLAHKRTEDEPFRLRPRPEVSWPRPPLPTPPPPTPPPAPPSPAPPP